MKKINLLSSIVCISFFALCVSSCQVNVEKNKEPEVIVSKQLRHIVLFKFKEDADPTVVKHIEEAFAALKGKIPEVRDFEWGLNNSPEGFDKGFTHCYFVTFDSEEDRATYLPHPDHVAFTKLLDGVLEDAIVVDYWNK